MTLGTRQRVKKEVGLAHQQVWLPIRSLLEQLHMFLLLFFFVTKLSDTGSTPLWLTSCKSEHPEQKPQVSALKTNKQTQVFKNSRQTEEENPVFAAPQLFTVPHSLQFMTWIIETVEPSCFKLQQLVAWVNNENKTPICKPLLSDPPQQRLFQTRSADK